MLLLIVLCCIIIIVVELFYCYCYCFAVVLSTQITTKIKKNYLRATVCNFAFPFFHVFLDIAKSYRYPSHRFACLTPLKTSTFQDTHFAAIAIIVSFLHRTLHLFKLQQQNNT